LIIFFNEQKKIIIFMKANLSFTFTAHAFGVKSMNLLPNLRL